jgi:hypothetical protein
VQRRKRYKKRKEEKLGHSHLERYRFLLGRELRSWRKAVNLNSKDFKAQGSIHDLKYRGSIQTDGVGVSI